MAAHITIKDRPCGWGKTTEILASYKPGNKYITVLPFLSEVDRMVKGAQRYSKFKMVAPSDNSKTKRESAQTLLEAGDSVACTHALFYSLGTLATQPVSTYVTGFDASDPSDLSNCKTHTKYLLDDYHLIVDEVVDPFDTIKGVTFREFQNDYEDLGLATVEEDGRVVPTPDWEQRFYAGSTTFKRDLFEAAKSGALYLLENRLFVLTIPIELLLRPKTTTIYTYLSEGTILLAFLRRLEKRLAGTADAFTLTVDKLSAAREKDWREDVRAALTIKSIPTLEVFNWAHGGQTKTFQGAAGQTACRSAGNALKKFAGSELRGVDRRRVMLTCARENWKAHIEGKKPLAGRVAKHSRLFGRAAVEFPDKPTGALTYQTTGVQWVGNTTRGVNDYITCSHAVYLYNQNPNPQLLQFLGMQQGTREAAEFTNAYALSELVQWLFRCSIRSGGVNGTGRPFEQRLKATVYIPSDRMRNLLINWLNTGEISSTTPSAQMDGTLGSVKELL